MSAELHSLLARLHAELQGTPQLDAQARQQLQEIAADLSRLGEVGATGDATAGAHASRLEGMVARFDGSHPQLAASLRELADTLGRAGL
jgi:hypothetical protein